MSEPIFAYIAADSAWNGAPTVLGQSQGVTMPQTPNGSLVLGYFNRSTQNNAGRLMVTSGGSVPLPLNVPALARSISIYVNNWAANNLNVTNVSVNTNTPIMVEAFGPGIPGAQPMALTAGTPVQLALGQAAQGTTPPSWNLLSLTSNSATSETLAVIGGPQDATGNNAYVIGLNADADTGPPPQNPPPPGYYATRTGNTYSLQFNWSAVSIYVANLSSQTAKPVTVLLQSL